MVPMQLLSCLSLPLVVMTAAGATYIPTFYKT